MKSLSGLDATFLYLETPEMPMHVGSFSLCALPAGFKGSFHKAVVEHIAKRMHLAPVFSRKLVFMPLDLGHPAWVEAESVDIGFHIRRACLASGPAEKSVVSMTLEQAHQVCAQLHGQLIDRNFPLWEFYVFDRVKLPDGKIVGAFFSKIHHAALDGKGAVLLANALLDLTLNPRDVPLPQPDGKPLRESDLKTSKMIGSVFSSTWAQLLRAAKSLPTVVASVSSALASQSSQSANTASGAAGAKLKMPVKLAPFTPFNVGISTNRVFVTATLPLTECKAVSKSLGGSLNDIVLWICSTALRNYLMQHHSLPKKSLVAAMPVSLRDTAATGQPHLGNQVSMTLVELGTHQADPLKRLAVIIASTGKVKTSMQSLKGLLPTDYPSLLAPWLVGGAAKMALTAFGKLGSSALASKLPLVANLVISNVPGAPVPLYLAGAEVLSFHPLSIITHGLGLNITIQTYAGRVEFGIVADKQVLLHAADFAAAIYEAFAQAQTLPASPGLDVKPPVAQAIEKAKLTKLSSVKSPPKGDTASSRSAPKTSVSTHGKPRTKKIVIRKTTQP